MRMLIVVTSLVMLSSPGIAQVIGDVVYLKSGGPAMTVTEILPRLDLSGTDVGVRWFGGATMFAGTFPATSVQANDPFPTVNKEQKAELCKVSPATVGC